MFEWLTSERTVMASIVISLVSYFLSFRVPNLSQGKMLRTAALVLIGCSTVFGWATTDSLKFGYYTLTSGYLPILIFIIWRYFKDHTGLFTDSTKNVTPDNFQFNTIKSKPKKQVIAEVPVEDEDNDKQAVDETTKDTGEQI